MFSTRSARFLFLISLPLLILSCQENVSKEEVEVFDEDMITASQMADDYMETNESGRRNSPIAVTVLRYIDGVLHYATNTDDLRGYRVVNEETITAYVQPGEFIFWFAGSGVSYLDGIDFDVVAQYHLGDNASEANSGMLWLVRIPEDIEVDDDGELKYDIIYGCKDNDGNPIRLDPKLKIQ